MAADPPFAHLATRTTYSLRDGAVRPRELAEAAARAGMSHVGVTDRDGLYGAVRVALACTEVDVTPVFGADLALEPDDRRPGWRITRAGRHRLPPAEDGGSDPRRRRPRAGPGWLEDDAARITLLARDEHGYGGLCRAVSAAHRDVRSAPHLDWDDVVRRPGGMAVLLGADSPAGRLAIAGRADAAETEARRWVEAFGPESVFIAVRHHLGRGDDRRTGRMLELADRVGQHTGGRGGTAVATNDVRYLREGDAHLADVLTCVREQVPVGSRHLARGTAEGWFKTADDLLRIPLFRDRPQLLSNAYELATSCEVDLGLHTTHAPRLTGLSEETAARELHVRCWLGVRDRFSRLTPEVTDRLRRELAMIDELGLHDYFLTVADIVDGIREMGVLTACRGSAAGSLVCFALRISDVDPVANRLVFERFMNPYRDELPDIDIDVESARREDVYRMIMARYGGGPAGPENGAVADGGAGVAGGSGSSFEGMRTACVAMVETFQARMAVREVGKALALPEGEIDLVAKAFRRVRARDVRTAISELPELRGSRIDAGQLEVLLQIVERIDGFPRHLALHPCGIVLADSALLDRTPLERSANGFPMTPFDKDDIAALGMLKLDVLAVRLLSAMSHAVALIPASRGEQVDITDLPAEDREVYDLLGTTRSIGVFQVESPGQQELLGRLQPERFEDLVTEISLFRPGPVKADMVSPFVARRRGEEEAVYVHPLLEPVLGETYGVVVYHEQVMGAVAALTGCDLAEADLVRRQLADDRRLPTVRRWALRCAAERGFGEEEAEAVWKQVESFASFGFCKAHAAAFAVPTYRSAWLKRWYLPELTAGLLTHDPGMFPARLMLEEARQWGVAVLGPDVNVSAEAYTVERVPAVVADRQLGLRGPDGGWIETLPPGWTWPAGAGPATGDRRPVPPAGGDRGDAGASPDGHPARWAVRIGLQDVHGSSEAERERLLAGRPYASVEDLRRRGGISRPTAEALVRAGALDRLAGITPSRRRRLLLEVEERWRGAVRRHDGGRPGTGGAGAARSGTGEAEQIGFDLDADHRPSLPPASLADVVRDEVAVLGLDVTRHVIAFYEPLLDALGVVRAFDLDRRDAEGTPPVSDGSRVKVAGVRVALQSPPVRSGQRVMFLTLDDRTGTIQANFFSRPLERSAWTLLNAWLVVVEGRVRRSGPRGVTVLADRAWDLGRLWRAWGSGRLETELARSGPPPPHERRAERPDGLRASMFAEGSR